MSVTLHLNAWVDGGCPIVYFVVEYKPKNQQDWTLVSNSVKAGGNFVVLDLNPATWYNLRVTAHNNAGFSIAEYEFATLTATGGTLAPPFGGNVNNAETKSSFPGLPEWIDLNIIVPVSATIIVVCVGILVVCVALSRRKTPPLMNPEEYAQFYGAMNTMRNGGVVTMRKDGLPYDEMGYVPPPNRKLPPVPGTNSNYNTIDRIKKGGHSMPGQEEDISPYATFHLLGMREEAKAAAAAAAQNFQTMPSTPGSGPLTGPNTPAHQRNPQAAQTMFNPRRSVPNQAAPGMQLYDAPNCDYEPPTNFQQNFGNPYDCPEGFYNASMMSSVGYSQVADYTGKPNQQLLPGQIIAQQAQQQQQQMMNQSSYGQYPQPHAEYSTDTVIYKGGPQPGPQPGAQARGPLPSAEEEFPPPPPERSSNDNSFTTQSNVTSECSEAECDREPLVRQRASPVDPSKELTTEEMRKLIERNEIVQTNGLKPYNTVNI